MEASSSNNVNFKILIHQDRNLLSLIRYNEKFLKSLPSECPRYDTKQSDDEVPEMLELWGMWITPFLPSFPVYSHNKYAYIHIYMFMQDTY